MNPKFTCNLNCRAPDCNPDQEVNLEQVRRVSVGSIQLRRSNSPVCRRREKRLTRISLTIVWLFLFCHIWKLIPTGYEVIFGDEHFPDWTHFIKHLSHALIVLNSSLNFLIYILLWTKIKVSLYLSSTNLMWKKYQHQSTHTYLLMSFYQSRGFTLFRVSFWHLSVFHLFLRCEKWTSKTGTKQQNTSCDSLCSIIMILWNKCMSLSKKWTDIQS